jgi:hypothetical protein
MFTTRTLLSLTVAASVVSGGILTGSALVNAQHGAHAAHPQHVGSAAQPVPTMPGQDAFGAIQEIVRILEADPNTDWNKIDLAALREHLIDMNEVTLKAVAVERRVDNGLQVDVTGTGRTLEAIKRMIPAHGQELNRLHNWRAATEPLANGVRLTVTSSEPAKAAHIRGLGFIGLLVSGSHHQPHHLMMAMGKHYEPAEVISMNGFDYVFYRPKAN